MYADRKLIEQLLFDSEISSEQIAKVAGIKSATTIRKFRNGESNLDNMRLGNAESLTKYAEETFCSDSKTSEKIEWLLSEFSLAGNHLSHCELLKKMTDNYVELVKGHFVDLEK